MEDLYLLYALAGLLAVALILAGRRLADLPFTEPMVGLVAGVVLGGAGLELLTISDEHRTTILLEGSRALLAVSLIAVALRFPVRELRGVLRPVAVLVVLGMPVLTAVSAALAVGFLGLPWEVGLVLGACLCPTDPILASGVVTGAAAEGTLPTRTRQVISAESGVNDGLALPIVVLGIAAALGDGLAGSALSATYEVVVAIVVAAPIGYVVARLARAAEEDDDVERMPELMLTLFMAVGVLGLARLVQADGVLAVFVAGLTYNAATPAREREDQDRLDEAFNTYFVVPLFVVVGAVLPVDDWVELGWGALAFAVGVLLLRRPPAVLLLGRAAALALRDRVFVGWFGPIGVSAVFYLAHAEHEGVADQRLFAAGTLAVAASTVVHGVTQIAGRQLYARLAGLR